MTTHLDYIKQVAAIATARLPENERHKLDAMITYGMGKPNLRGVTYHARWQNGHDAPISFVEICAAGEENDIQLAGTTIHELAHVLAGPGAGHGADWKRACEQLGLLNAKAAGNIYTLEQFADRAQIEALPTPTDGNLVKGSALGGVKRTGGCALGIGTRGGKSRGAGSGSRLRRFVCDCDPPVIVRAARDELNATCNDCNAQFHA